MKFFLLFIGLFLSAWTFSQTQVEFRVDIVNKKTGKAEAGATVKVLDNGSTATSLTSPSNGKLKFNLPDGKVYKVEVSKSGFVTRFLFVNTQNINLELLQGSSPLARFEVSLFEEVQGIDYSFIKSNPITEFKYDGQSDELAYNPTMASKMSTQVEKVLAEAEKKANGSADFNKLVQEANALATQKKYQEALTKYEAALSLNPTDAYVNKQIIEMDRLIKAEKQASIMDGQAADEYSGLIFAADELKKQKKYKEAIAKYQEALTKKNEQYPKDQIEDLEDLILKQEKELANQKKYTDAIAAAEILFKQKSYKSAREQYVIAQKLKPSETVPPTKIAEIDKLLEAEKAVQEKKNQYNTLVEDGDKLYNEEKWEEAKQKYVEAKAIENASSYLTDRIADCDKKIAAIAAEKAKQLQIEKLLAEGQKEMDASKWEMAKTKYNEVLKLDTENATAKAKISEIEVKINEEKQKKELEANFTKLVADGDALIKTSKFEDAIAKYEAAIKLKTDPAVSQKITDAQAQLANQKSAAEKKAQYDAAMLEGDNLFKQSKWEEAKGKYTEASNLDPAQQLPKDKIKLAEAELLKLADAANKKAKFDAAMAEGETLLTAGKLPEAKIKFIEAKGIDGSKPEPQQKIDAIDKEIKALADAKSKQEQFDALIKAGDDFVTAGKLTEAKTKFEEAGKLDPASTVPPQKISAVEKAIADQQSLQAEADKKAKYDAAMKAGEDLFTAKKWNEAKTKFSEAKQIDGSQTLPDQRIAAVETELSKLAESEAKNKQIEALLKEGKTALDGKDFNTALQKYQAVLAVDNTNQTAKDGVTAAQNGLTNLQAEAAKKAQFEQIKQQANTAFEAKNWNEAKTLYNQAKAIQADSEIEKKLADIEKKLIEEQAALAAEKSAAEKKALFDAAMMEGENLFANGKLSDAKAKFVQAKSIDASKPEPQQKIDIIDAQLKAEADTKAKKEQFDALLKAGDELAAASKWAEAKEKYTEAGNLDPSNAIPPQKIAQIDQAMNDSQAQKALAEKKVQYDAAMKSGEDLFTAKKWDEAKTKFLEAKQIDATQSKPDERIAAIELEKSKMAQADALNKQINNLLAEAKSAFDAKDYTNALQKYQAVLAIDNANKPAQDGLSATQNAFNAAQSETQKLAQFQQFKQKGIEAFSNQNWTEAKTFLTQAKAIQTDAEIDQKLVEIDQKINEQAQAELLDQAYKKALADGESLANSQKYDEAIAKFKEASSKKPQESLPKTRIQEIENLKAQSSAQQQIDQKYRSVMDKGNQAMSEKNYLEAIKLFNEAMSIKPNEQDPIDKAKEAERLEKEKSSDEDRNYQKVLEAGQKAIDNKDWDKATDYYKRAIDLAESLKKDKTVPQGKLSEIDRLKQEELASKNALAEKDKQYQQKMNEGSAKLLANEFDAAILLFQEAKSVKPTETTPDQKIAEANQKKNALANAAQAKANYEAAMKRGSDALTSKKYDVALSEFKDALNAQPNDVTATNKIKEVEQILDDLTNQNKANAIKSEFDALVKEGDQLMKQASFSAALAKYEAADAKMKGDQHVKMQITLIKKKFEESKMVAAAYDKLIKQGDKEFNASDYKNAQKSFNEALKLKPSDTYATSRLNEIDKILNPVVVQNGPLPNLGIPTNNSIMDGQALLQKAEEERKSRKNVRLKNKMHQVEDQQVAISQTEEKQVIANKEEIATAVKVNEEKTITDDESRQLTIETVNAIQIQAENQEINNQGYDYSDQLSNDEKFQLMHAENAVEYVQSEAVYHENTEVVKGIYTAYSNQVDENNQHDYEGQIDNRGTIEMVTIQVAEKVVDDTEARKITETDVRNAQITVETAESENREQADIYVRNNKESIQTTEIVQMDKTIQESKNALENADVAVQIRTKAEDQIIDIDAQKTEQLYENDHKISESVKLIAEETEDADLNRQQTVETVKQIDQKKVDEELIAFDKNMVKALTNKDVIVTQEKKNIGVVEQEEEAKALLIKEVEKVDKQAQTKTVENGLNDDQQRQQAKEIVSASEVEVANKAITEVEKPKENAETLKSVTTNVSGLELKNADKQNQNTLDAKKLIEKFANNEIKFDDKVANALGAQFPEGVSQESFNQLDEEGLLRAVITRRIVVKNGYGEIFVRTQTLNGVTYSRNGQPTSEYIWQKETQDSRLVKNY